LRLQVKGSVLLQRPVLNAFDTVFLCPLGVNAVKKLLRLSVLCVPLMLAAIVPAIAQSISPIALVPSAKQSVTVSGTSGGGQRGSGCVGNVGLEPNHVVRIQEDGNLQFQVEGGADVTLLVVGDTNKFCVAASKLDQGKVAISGRWKKGSYQVFVGNQSKTRDAYNLTIGPSKT
jgi:hypothetical protein